MSQPINYELAKDALSKLNTDDTISSAHGLLCGFYCVKQDIELDDWLNEIIVSIDLNNLLEKEATMPSAAALAKTLLPLFPRQGSAKDRSKSAGTPFLSVLKPYRMEDSEDLEQEFLFPLLGTQRR